MRYVGGSVEVSQSGKILPQVGNTTTNSSSAVKSVTNQCSNGSQDETQRQVMEVESTGHKLEVKNMPEEEHKKMKIWREPILGTQHYQMCCKLKKLKELFKTNSRELGDISDRARETKEALENC
ncbi:unnamed protein product [Ilex paraguariensis]|uniref:Uncharacterized protein n=1 Tax=Ilex paraguariensis TaxID=185542 RepID=A0ABC8SJF6_9AQUA